MVLRARSTVPLLVVAAVLSSTPAVAGPRDFVLSMSGFLGTTEQAEPVLTKLFRHLERRLGWPERSISGSYHPDPVEGLEAIRRSAPGFALVTFQMYAEQRGPMKMEVIGGMELADGAMSRFHVVTKEGGPSSLAELAGATIASPHATEQRFAERVLLGGKVPLGPGGAKAVHVRAPLAALRQVDRGEAAAAVVDDPVVRQLSKLPFGSGLRVIHSTPELPPLPIVALAPATPADRQAMAKALVGLCSPGEGAELCRSLQLSSVRAVTERTYAKVLADLR